jgi:hypothetical protein
MDECWAAGKVLLSTHRRLCLDCHDECLPKVTRSARPPRRSTAPDTSLDIRRLLMAPYEAR